MTLLSEYLAIGNVFEVESVFDVSDEHGQLTLTERRIKPTYFKDYDTIEDPLQWPELFNVSSWGLFTAYSAGDRVGGAIAAFRSPGLALLESRSDLVALWDLRVAPEMRRSGVGTALFRAVDSWARVRHCQELKVETQNTNVSACRFYERQGCQLKRVNRNAYVEIPDEIQFIWSKQL